MPNDRRKILRAIKREGQHIKDPHARRVYLKSAVETGIVESGLTNPSGGDADSGGWRQERRSLYANPTNIDAAARRFRQEFQQKYQPGEKSYQVAAQVQRPAAQYRGRYRDVAGRASQVLAGDKGSEPNTRQGASYTTTPGVDNSDLRTQAKLAYLQNTHDPNALFTLASNLRQSQDTPSTRVRVPGQAKPDHKTGGGQSRLPTGAANFEGKKVAAWIKPALVYARKQGWKGTVQSGYRSRADQTRIYNSGVRPAAKPGTSNHEGAEYPRGAVDVTDAQVLSDILKNSKYRKRLQYAGAKDPVHFSHPHGGSY